MDFFNVKMDNIDNSDFAVYYISPTIGPEPLRVAMAGDEQCAPGYRLTRQEAPISVLLYLLYGEGTLYLGGTVRHLGPGDVLTIPKGATYHYEANRQNPWRILWFNIEGECYPTLLRQYGLLEDAVYKGANSALREGFVNALALCRGALSGEPLQDSLCTAVYGIVLALWRQYRGSTPNTDAAGGLCSYIHNQLSAAPGAPFIITDAADSLCLSVRQLERLFKERYRQTPYQYFQQQKLQLAKQYLLNTRLSIKEISNMLGYYDQYYFSNCFKAAEGVSPRVYRGV